MIFTGIILGPHVLNLLDDSIISISADLRQLALVIILTRAGLSLDITDLKKVGRPAILILLGILVGVICGYLLVSFFEKIHVRDSIKIIIVLSVSFLLIELEHRLNGIIPISGLLAIMSMGIFMNQKYSILANRLSVKYNKLWIVAELLLFALVGATLDLSYSLLMGISAIIVVILALIIRMIGVFVCMLKTNLNMNERLFCMISYTPKATVQAAIGGIPLAMGLACGQKVLTVAVLSILITAPFGAFLVDRMYKQLLQKNK